MKLFKITLPPQMQNEGSVKNFRYVAANSLQEVGKHNANALNIELITDDLKMY